MSEKKFKKDALDYHSSGRKGKIEVIPTKPYTSQRDLSLAYSPGVAEPCLAINKNNDNVYKYTAKGNLVAVISNGTAVLGLGDIGPEASKPVMEGKGLLFKIFADIDVFDIEVNETDVDKFIATVKAIAPTFGGINLEDIKAPEAFIIEERLKKELDIPIMHDDQHGTAIISSAALLNALEIAKKKIEKVKIVVSGAGASAQSCVKLYISLGVKKSNIFMYDSKGLIHESRKDQLDENKQFFMQHGKNPSLEEAFKNADVFLGLSKGGIVDESMIKNMAKNPIVFALANPNPEIEYDLAIKTRDDLIMATGRSDHPNQVNNVLGFPYIFRGALDVRATMINEEMKLAAVKAIALLAKEQVPDVVNEAYDAKSISFGRTQIIPKPLDPRLIYWVAPAVAKAAMDSGVAKKPIKDWKKYELNLMERLGLGNKLIRNLTAKAKRNPKKVVFAEADHYKILKAAEMALEEGIAIPILLGKRQKIQKIIDEYNLDLSNCEIIDPRNESELKHRESFAEILHEKRKRRGLTFYEAKKLMRERNYFAAAMVETGRADVMISGLTRSYKDSIRPALRVIGVEDGINKIAGMYILISKDGPMFFADTTININPTVEEIIDITLLVAKTVKQYKIEPKIALLSYSNFGSNEGEDAIKMREASKILHQKHPELIVDGELQANFAVNKELINDFFPFSMLSGNSANTLIFPSLSSGNIAYKLVQEMSQNEAIGPVLLGMKKPVHVLQIGSSVREILNMITLGVVDVQNRK
ncbi:MAG: NADP-dependent malic enzyme [Flavobacteriales bacterium]|jgi:malate dehydrogenase (oxaloacetate-decarboxylating)(NADP+)|nr:NADP-dependent malic enzyme [Flavobacteriales bacterium]MDG1440064.1 NADP-dependent malic enzyme [Flavobacteriales bacterium]MDG1798689.1 NADP-dependent malic enzyme [Flavobacteriales bacterium]